MKRPREVVAVDFRRRTRIDAVPSRRPASNKSTSGSNSGGAWAPPPDAQVIDGTLRCPRCGSEYLHHVDVDVWRRRGEDGDGESVSVSPCCSTEPTRTPRKAREFHGRRDHVELRFYCEQCDGDDWSGSLTLGIVQHKGVTMMRWLHVGKTRAGA